jgi:acyl carrier protein
MIEKIVSTVCEVLEAPVTIETSQSNCDHWDSLRHLNVIIAIEDAFDVSFEPEEFARMKSIKDIEIMLKEKNNHSL